MLGRTGGLRSDQLNAKRIREPAGNLVLKREQLNHLAIETLSPQMCVALGIDQLGVNADLVARASDTPFKHIAHAQLATDLLRVDGLVPVRERGIARDHETVRNP